MEQKANSIMEVYATMGTRKMRGNLPRNENYKAWKEMWKASESYENQTGYGKGEPEGAEEIALAEAIEKESGSYETLNGYGEDEPEVEEECVLAEALEEESEDYEFMSGYEEGEPEGEEEIALAEALEEESEGYGLLNGYEEGEPERDKDCALAEAIEREAESYKDMSDSQGIFDSGHEIGEEKKKPYEYAMRLLLKHDIRFIDPSNAGRLHRFNGRIWEPLSSLEDLGILVYEEMTEEDKMAQGNIDNFFKQVATHIKYECIAKYKSGEDRFTDDDFKEIENQIVFNNCVYDTRTGAILPHDRNLPYYLGIDAEYLEEDVHTPVYEKLKTDATDGDEDSMRMFDLMLGYLMIPNRSGKCYFVMADARDSGKSVFGHFIESIFSGERVKTIDLGHLSGRFALSNVDSVLLLSGLEICKGKLSAAVVEEIKKITGEKNIRVESKYHNEQTVPIRFKMLLATNGGMCLPPGMTDEAFYRRTIVIPFIKSMPLKSHMADMPELLQKEKSAILSKAAREVGAIINAEGGILFPESKLSKNMKESWIGGLSFGGDFIEERLRFTGNPEDAIPKDDIYAQYCGFFSEIIEGGGMVANATMLTKEGLMHCISEKYPRAAPKKLRRESAADANKKARPCITCLCWK